MEQVHLFAELAVVALGGFFQHGQMGAQIFAVLEGRAIDALKHRARAVAAPIGPGHRHQLERIGRKLPGVLQMRATAEVLPVAVPVHAQGLIAGDAFDQLNFVRFAALFVMCNCARTVPNLGANRVAQVDDLLHLGFDLAKVFRGERFGTVKIVIPAILDDRPDGDLHIRPDFLNGAGHHMRKVVADQFQRRRVILKGVDGNLRILMDRPLQIVMRAIDLCRDRLFRKTHGNGCGNFGRRYTGFILPDIAIGKGEGNLGHRGLLVGLAPTERPVAGYILPDMRGGVKIVNHARLPWIGPVAAV